MIAFLSRSLSPASMRRFTLGQHLFIGAQTHASKHSIEYVASLIMYNKLLKTSTFVFIMLMLRQKRKPHNKVIYLHNPLKQQQNRRKLADANSRGCVFMLAIRFLLYNGFCVQFCVLQHISSANLDSVTADQGTYQMRPPPRLCAQNAPRHAVARECFS